MEIGRETFSLPTGWTCERKGKIELLPNFRKCTKSTQLAPVRTGDKKVQRCKRWSPPVAQVVSPVSLLLMKPLACDWQRRHLLDPVSLLQVLQEPLLLSFHQIPLLVVWMKRAPRTLAPDVIATLVNSAAMNTHVQVFMWTYILISLG